MHTVLISIKCREIPPAQKITPYLGTSAVGMVRAEVAVVMVDLRCMMRRNLVSPAWRCFLCARVCVFTCTCPHVCVSVCL